MTVLLLAGSAGLASFDEPDGGGTVPAYQVWLPVVAGQTVPSYCLMGTFVVERSGFVGWWGGEFIAYEYIDGIPDTWTGIVATEPDFREESILSSGPWHDLELGHGYRIWATQVPSEYIQIGRRYYSRIEYECRGYHVRMVSSAIAQ